MREGPVGRIASYNSTTGLGETGNEDGRLLTLLDYFESGRRSARDYLSKQPAPGGTTLLHVAQACALACVRVETEIDRGRNGAKAVVHGSGVIVADGRYILTAGHAFAVEKILAVRVILTDGRVLQATVAGKDYDQFDTTGRDWAVLKLREDRPTDLVSLKLGAAKEHAAVIGIGYPDIIGINENGHIAFGSDAPLAPLLFPAHINGTDPITMTPAAGAVPIGGISGGPVVNAVGEVVGIFVSVSKTPAKDMMIISYGATPVAAFRDAIGEK